jgi:hypothetical protein
MPIAASLILSATIWYGVLCGLLGPRPGARLWLRWPVDIWDQIKSTPRRLAFTEQPIPRRADYVKIAELEYELFGIEPKPGTAAAFAINARHVFKPDNQ